MSEERDLEDKAWAVLRRQENPIPWACVYLVLQGLAKVAVSTDRAVDLLRDISRDMVRR